MARRISSGKPGTVRHRPDVEPDLEPLVSEERSDKLKEVPGIGSGVRNEDSRFGHMRSVCSSGVAPPEAYRTSGVPKPVEGFSHVWDRFG